MTLSSPPNKSQNKFQGPHSSTGALVTVKRIDTHHHRSPLMQGADTTILNHIYKAVIRSVLYVVTLRTRFINYDWSMCSPSMLKIVTKQWQQSPTSLIQQLCWLSLAEKRLYFKLCVCKRILRDESLIPSSVFVLHPRPSRIHRNNK